MPALGGPPVTTLRSNDCRNQVDGWKAVRMDTKVNPFEATRLLLRRFAVLPLVTRYVFLICSLVAED